MTEEEKDQDEKDQIEYEKWRETVWKPTPREAWFASRQSMRGKNERLRWFIDEMDGEIKKLHAELVSKEKISCKHERLMLEGCDRPEGLPETTLWMSDPSLVCSDCGTHLMSSPRNLTLIINIPHPRRDECLHPYNHRGYSLNGFGRWECLQCGEVGITSPASKLDILPGKIGGTSPGRSDRND